MKSYFFKTCVSRHSRLFPKLMEFRRINTVRWFIGTYIFFILNFVVCLNDLQAATVVPVSQIKSKSVNASSFVSHNYDGGTDWSVQENIYMETEGADFLMLQEPPLMVQLVLLPESQTFSAPDDSITYQLSVGNNGNFPVFNIDIDDDDFDDGFDYQSGDNNNNDTLDVGETWLYTAGYTVANVDIERGFYIAEVNINAQSDTDGDGNGDTPVNGDDDVRVELNRLSGIEVNIEPNPNEQSYSAEGDLINYRITLTNTGNISMHNIEITTVGDGNSFSLQGGDLNNNNVLDYTELWLFDSSHEVSQEDVNAGSYTFSITVTGQVDSNGDGTNDETVSDNDELTINAELIPAIELTKELFPTGQKFEAIDDVLNFRLTLTNTGNAPVYNPVVTDNIASGEPAYESGDIANEGILDPNETWIYTVSYQVRRADLNRGFFRNTATASGDVDINNDGTYDGEVNDEAEVTVNADLNPAIALTKALDPSEQTFDAVGDIITYQLELANTGNTPIYNPQVTDAGATNGTDYESGDTSGNDILDAGETWVYSAAYEIKQEDLTRGFYTNTASASGDFDTNNDGTYDGEVNG